MAGEVHGRGSAWQGKCIARGGKSAEYNSSENAVGKE